MRWILLVAALLTSCVGTIGSGHLTGDEGTVGSPSSTDTMATCAGPVSVGPVPLRRLSHGEYEATVRDLLPGVSVPKPALPRDPSSSGLENAADMLNPTGELVDAYRRFAILVAGEAVKNMRTLTGCATVDAACARTFLDRLLARAFRRPPLAQEQSAYLGLFDGQQVSIGVTNALRLVLEAVLQSPAFLYRMELGAGPAQDGWVKLTMYEVASRLSYLIGGTMPDEALLEAARTGRLADANQVRAEARRMLAGPRVRTMLVDFHRQWLDLDRVFEEPKDAVLFAGYATVRAAMREESDRLVGAVMADGDGKLPTLLTTNATEVNPDLARFYGVTAPPSGWAPAMLDPARRAGFLTRANFLAMTAHDKVGSPPLRGYFVLDRLLCEAPPEAPADADTSTPLPPTGTAARTNRQLFEARTQASSCLGCHERMNGIGFGLENFDAIGRYRTSDTGLAVDATGMLVGTDVDGAFTGGVELSRKLAQSRKIASCAASRWWEYAYGRRLDETERCSLRGLEEALARGGVRELLTSLVGSREFLNRKEGQR